MGNVDLVSSLKDGPEIDPNEDENVFNSIWSEYERVIVQSLITSFGMDFLVRDQYGGDVDTILNVRKIGTDPQMKYKNKQNAVDYENRGPYSHKQVEGAGTNYQRIKHEARKKYHEDNRNTVQDAYENKPLGFLGKSKGHPTDQSAELDHVISAKKIHDDRGRVLSGLSTKDLADSEDNLRWTNEHLNKSMGADEIPDYVKAHPELPKDVKKRLMNEYKRSKKSYEAKIAKAYYTSPKFIKDTAVAASKRGLEMGLRQALGFIMTEVWFCTKNEIREIGAGSSFKEILIATGNGIKKGFESAKSKYKEIIAKFGEGLSSGILASLTTTICNIFFTTAKNLIKCIRQMYASVIEAAKVLLFNPENLMLGDRIKSTIIILATGASVLVGSSIGSLIEKIPTIGPVVSPFCSTMISGLLSCTLLLVLDRSSFINNLVDRMNEIPSEANNYREIADAMEGLAAKIADLDIELFKQETSKYSYVAKKIAGCEDDEKLSSILKSAYEVFDIALPWQGDFDEFMGNRSNHLVFN